MGFLENALHRMGYTKMQPVQTDSPVIRNLGAEYQYQLEEFTTVGNQAGLMRRLSWVYSAVNIVSDIAAGCELSVKERKGEKTSDIPNHPLEILLARPNPLQSRFEFLKAIFAYLKLTGNGYVYLNRVNENSIPTELWVIPSQYLRPLPDERSFIRGYEYVAGGQDIILSVQDIIHFRQYNPTNPLVGLSAIESLSLSAVSDLAMQKWNANLFGKENAKLPGALVLKDKKQQAEFDRVKAEMKKEWGGTQRGGPMLINGAGEVSWLNMGIAQKDLEFLASREFSRDEIYGVLAPGLASMLAVNATEANSKSGKATLIDYAVWPALCLVAEKITNDLLPLYGENLVAEFDDIRITDRVIGLQEIDEYAKFHTLNEVRERYYDSGKIADERGEMIASQVSAEAPGETPPQLQPFVGQNNPPKEEPRPDVSQPEELEDENEAAAQADLKRWQRKALKAVKAGKSAVVEFESEAIPGDEYKRITANLQTAKTAEDVKAAFWLAPASELSRLASALEKAYDGKYANG